MLSRELKDLEQNHLITVEYAITGYGATLKSVISVIADWGWSIEGKLLGSELFAARKGNRAGHIEPLQKVIGAIRDY